MAGALLLVLVACGSEMALEDQRTAAVPQELRTGFEEAARARYALVSCRGPEQLQAIGGLDSLRTRAEQALARRFAGIDIQSVKAAGERSAIANEVAPCAGDAGIARYRRAVQTLAQLGQAQN